MSELTANVNWIAVIVGFVAAYGFGWIWYGPLFGKPWSSALGLKIPDKLPVLAMATQAVGTFLLAWLAGVTAVSNHLATFILAVLMVVALMKANAFYSGRPMRALTIEIGYVIAMAVIVVAAQAIF
jgi:hypothetical protein